MAKQAVLDVERQNVRVMQFKNGSRFNERIIGRLGILSSLNFGGHPLWQSISTLVSGWNLIGLTLHNTDTGTNRSIPLAEGWNLIGYSANVTENVSDVKFVNSSGNSANWSTATSQGKVQAYLTYRQNNVQKYAAPPELSMNDYALRQNKGYWVKINQAGGGNLSMPSVGGSLSGETYEWKNLRFRNSSGTELNITEAGNADWLDTTMIYRNATINGWGNILSTPIEPEDKSTFSSWEGVFIKANQNINLIRRN